MPLRVAYIPHLESDTEGAQWAENTMLVNLIANSSKDVEIIPAYKIYNCLDPDEIDLVCLHNLAHTATYRRRWIRGGARLERVLGRPIPAFYDSDYDSISALSDRPILMGGVRGNQGLSIAKRFLKHFDAIHTSNHYLRDKVLEYGARDAHVLYPGVDLVRFRPMPNLRPDKFTIGWAGDATKPMKNVHLVKRLGYKHIMATKENFIPHKLMGEFYNSCDVYTYFSSHEGCNRTILEAMACGLPVVTSEAGAVRELIDPRWIVEGEPGYDDWMTRFHNKVEELRGDPKLRFTVGELNREKVRAWGWGPITERFESICKRLVYALAG